MTARIATRLVVDNLTGKTIRAPAHWLAPPRITATDVREHGSLAAARAVKWGVS